MPDVAQYLQSASFGVSVSNITKNTRDGFTAGGFSAWVQSITGSTPQVKNLGNGRAKVVLTQGQILLMQKWLDSITAKPLKPPRVEYALGPVISPWVLKKAIVPAIGLIAAGFLFGWLSFR